MQSWGKDNWNSTPPIPGHHRRMQYSFAESVLLSLLRLFEIFQLMSSDRQAGLRRLFSTEILSGQLEAVAPWEADLTHFVVPML